jgi:ubiquinone/menaquinone biosynthesis C-methylase UbiE
MSDSGSELPFKIEELEERKRLEIEHSRVRRTILQGAERQADTHANEQAFGLDSLIRDKAAFDYHFSNIKFYSVARASEQFQHELMRQMCGTGKTVLDFACGSGENGIYAAQLGADVVGIDISPEGITNANLNAEGAGVASHCRFEVMDGEKMRFADNTFDSAVEYGALHHVDLDRALAELSRVLKPGAKMICVEALRHNPLIHAYRKRTPHLRTAWEVDHILGVESLDVARRYFSNVEVRFFHLAVLAAVPFRKTPFFRPLRSFLELIDRFLLSSTAVGKFGWIMVFVMAEPRKKQASD